MKAKSLHITCIGPASSGKSTYINQVLGQAQFGSSGRTIGAHLEFHEQIVDAHPRHLHLWEVGGSVPAAEEKRQEIINSHLKNTELVLVFCDLSDPQALAKIAERFSPKQLKAKCTNPRTKFVLIGTRATPAISEDAFEDFAIANEFKNWFTPSNKKECLSSFKLSLQAVLDARRDALNEKVDRYYLRRFSESLRSFVAYLASLLHLSYFFGHSKEEDKLTAASALKIALTGNTHYLRTLKEPEKNALKHDRLGKLYTEARNLIDEESEPVQPRRSFSR